MDREQNYIRWLAIVLMVLDHVGLWLFDNNLIMRFFGQAAFGLFAWMIIKGNENTKDWTEYLYRLLIIGIIGQVPYMLLGMNTVNPLLGLASGLIVIRAYEENIIYSFILFFAFVTVGVSVYEISLVVLMYAFRDDLNYTVMVLIGLAVVRASMIHPVALGGCLTALVLVYPLRIKYMMSRAVYYMIYPVHLTLIWWWRVLIT